MDRIAPLQNPSQEQNLLLKVGSQIEQIHQDSKLMPYPTTRLRPSPKRSR
jgi:hypothetical protein